jgi:hypothetical protein
LRESNYIFEMSKEQNIKTFTTTDIERYHKGLMSAKERHVLEKAALDDPFLADALEGYDHAAVNMNEDLVELRRRLDDRTGKPETNPVIPVRKSWFTWWKVAAMIIGVSGAGLLVYSLAVNNKSNELAQAENKSPVSTGVKDSAIDSAPSAGVTSNNAKADTPRMKANDSDEKLVQGIKVIPPSDTKGESANEKEAAIADKKDDVAKRETEKSVASENLQGLAKNKDANATNPVLLQEELKVKSPESKSAPAVTPGASQKKAESNRAVAAAAPQVNQAFLNQTNVFRGRVTDNNNNALPFTNITNLEDTVGTYSDARGYFTLTSPDSILNVQIRSLGFETSNVQLNHTNQENKIQLDEDRSISARVLDTVKRNTNRSRNSTMTLDEPEPADGWNNYDMYLANNLKIPESFKSKQSGGIVELTFDVDEMGAPYNIKVKKSLCNICDKEAVRLIKEGPRWKRKVKKGKATVTVSF